MSVERRPSLNLVQGFTRQETLKLTGCTSSRLSYLEKVNLVVPMRIGSNKRPTVMFTWEQLLEIRAIKNLRKDVSLQTVRKVVDTLNRCGFDDSLRDKLLVIFGDDVLWIKPDWSDFVPPTALIVASKDKSSIGQFALLVIPPFTEIVNELWETAQASKVIDFDSFKERAKAQPAA